MDTRPLHLFTTTSRYVSMAEVTFNWWNVAKLISSTLPHFLTLSSSYVQYVELRQVFFDVRVSLAALHVTINTWSIVRRHLLSNTTQVMKFNTWNNGTFTI